MRIQYEPDEKHHKVVISGKFPTLNEYLSACGKNPRAGGKMKRDYMMLAASEIRYQLRRYKAKKPLIIHIWYFEPDMRRDKDNIHSMFIKCFLDALQKCDVIHNDGWNEIENFTHDFLVDKKNPRIEVYLEELDT